MGPTSNTLCRCVPARGWQLWQHPAGHPAQAECWDQGLRLWPGRLPLGTGDCLSMVPTRQHSLACPAGALGNRYCPVRWAPPKISSLRDNRAAVKRSVSISMRAGGDLPFKDRTSSRHARGSGGPVPAGQVRPQCLREAVSCSVLLRKCKNFQWGHRWPLGAKGLRKQLLAHTNVQQPKKYPFAHAIIC